VLAFRDWRDEVNAAAVDDEDDDEDDDDAADGVGVDGVDGVGGVGRRGSGAGFELVLRVLFKLRRVRG
jgi:hypothetical protein